MHEPRRMRVLTYTASLEGHWRGIAIVTAALRDAGMEVTYGSPLTFEEAANIAIQKDVDVISISIGVAIKWLKGCFSFWPKRFLNFCAWSRCRYKLLLLF